MCYSHAAGWTKTSHLTFPSLRTRQVAAARQSACLMNQSSQGCIDEGWGQEIDSLLKKTKQNNHHVHLSLVFVQRPVASQQQPLRTLRPLHPLSPLCQDRQKKRGFISPLKWRQGRQRSGRKVCVRGCVRAHVSEQAQGCETEKKGWRG